MKAHTADEQNRTLSLSKPALLSLKVLAAASVVLAVNGCAGFKSYFTDRANDAADIFTIAGGRGVGVACGGSGVGEGCGVGVASKAGALVMKPMLLRTSTVQTRQSLRTMPLTVSKSPAIIILPSSSKPMALTPPGIPNE